ncbi:MAG: hypothetical protein E6G70_25125 [Alphaproteobacteria bacterium]|nr:MAG: hypothetical protein E6G70_25125 [Alphaproteobacteria bacterium]
MLKLISGIAVVMVVVTVAATSTVAAIFMAEAAIAAFTLPISAARATRAADRHFPVRPRSETSVASTTR